MNYRERRICRRQQVIGLTQKEMGALTNRAARTIQAVELGTLPLSEGLAVQISGGPGLRRGKPARVGRSRRR